MNHVHPNAELDNQKSDQSHNDDLDVQAKSVLLHAADAQRQGHRVYESLRNLNDVIGTEYGDRVLYELIQNAHDAHHPKTEGRIAIKLIIQSETDGTLYIANGGNGFQRKDVEAIKNLGISGKEIGEGIGNKGLGFRSVEALTDDVRIFSRKGAEKTAHFDGYCFRFAQQQEIEDILKKEGIDATTSNETAQNVSRYLVPRPLCEHPEEVSAYAQRDYATVIVLPLTSAEAIDLANRQVKDLANLDVPLLLFLERIAEFRIDVETPDQPPFRRRLLRRHKLICDIPGIPCCRLFEVRVREDRRFLVLRYEVDKERVLDAVKQSIDRAPQIKRWLNWKGQPVVSVAVGLSAGAVETGRFYNFLPMGKAAESPLIGYIDAPFFTEIDRRNADFDLPLNMTLLEAAAEACATSALSIVTQNINIPQRAVFDLVAWTGERADKIGKAFKMAANSLRDASIIPIIANRGRKGWANLSEANLWPDDSFSLLKASEVVKHTDAQIVSGELDSRRLDRLKEIAKGEYISLLPKCSQIAEWLEIIAKSYLERKASPRTWSRFYVEINRLFDAVKGDLSELAGKDLLLDRSGKLCQSYQKDGVSRGLFVRSEIPKGKRVKEGIPFPPSGLTRRYRFLNEKITLQQEALDAFVKAGLLHEYDPVEALIGLRYTLRNKANKSRREEALRWAFRVWRTAGADVEEALKNAELYVPTFTGWLPAIETAFSASWTSTGRLLENYLIETAKVSPDCERAWDRLLIHMGSWPATKGSTKSQWIEFLKLLGVSDGLRLVKAQVENICSGKDWTNLIRSGLKEEGLDDDWCADNSVTHFRNPYTPYSMKGEAWRLPGQLEYKELTDNAKETFSELVFRHLEMYGPEFLTFKVGRFKRHESEWNMEILPTPLATFLRSKAWIAVNTKEGLKFRRSNKCWIARTRKGRPPRFVDRVPDAITNLIEDNNALADLVFSDKIGFLDWQSKQTAVERLEELASDPSTLSSHDRPTFSRAYRHAWHDVVETGVSLPTSLSLVVHRNASLESLKGDEAKPTIIVSQNSQQHEARVLSSAGWAVLDVGDEATKKATELLAETCMFTPRLIDGIGVRLLVDGEQFVPRANDPLLTSHNLSWLPEVVILGHELLGEQLERGVLRETVDRQIRAIRVRHCKEITLAIDDASVVTNETMMFYAFENQELPTLILTGSLGFDWQMLAFRFSDVISRLVDRRLRFLEPLLMRLSQDQAAGTLAPPSDEALCLALKCDARTLDVYRSSLRTDVGHVLHLLIPVVAYFKGTGFARQIEKDADFEGVGFNIRQWLQSHFADIDLEVSELVDICEQVADRTVLRQKLGLDYEKFNRVLLDLGESPLSNEIELRSLYGAYLAEMQPMIIDRLRRRYTADFRNGLDLSPYVEYKTLTFLPFNTQWKLTRETLDVEIVKAYVSKLLDETLGEDIIIDLPSFQRLIERNRKSVRDFATQTFSTVGAWCNRNQVSTPDPWVNDSPQFLTQRLEDAGFLDFEPVKQDQLPILCRRAMCWPEGMPETISYPELGLDLTEIEIEEKRRKHEKEQKKIEQRSIDFAGHTLDTGDSSFADSFLRLAEKSISSDDSWFERSHRRLKLNDWIESGSRGRQHSVGTGGSKRSRASPPDDQRRAMGISSEWLAFQFLRRRHKEFFNENCWISRNRSYFFGGDDGDDTVGYDFCVKTSRAEWLYEVKSSLEDSCEFEMTANEMQVASGASKDGRRRYRILYVPFVFSPDRWCVLELPNPMGGTTRTQFKEIGRGSIRFRFERAR